MRNFKFRKQIFMKSNTKHLQYYAKMCSEFAEPFSAALHQGNTASKEKLIMRLIWPGRELNFRSLAPETDALAHNQR